jgi:hypothetical protein
VVALTNEDDDHALIVGAAAAQIGLQTLPRFTTRKVEEQDWVRLTQSQFAPIHIGKNIWVVPSWHEAPDPDALILEVDPGLAFGTGSHPTTRLCMEWLEAHPGEELPEYFVTSMDLSAKDHIRAQAAIQRCGPTAPSASVWRCASDGRCLPSAGVVASTLHRNAKPRPDPDLRAFAAPRH